jgi:hypothetical protein
VDRRRRQLLERRQQHFVDNDAGKEQHRHNAEQTSKPGVNVIKLFILQFTNVCSKLVFAPGKLFQPSLANILA